MGPHARGFNRSPSLTWEERTGKKRRCSYVFSDSINSFMSRQGPHGGGNDSDRWITEPRQYPLCAPPGEIKDDKVDENDRFVASFVNGRSVSSLVTFPSKILDSNEKLFALFKIWKDENQLYFPPGREEARRFKGFKKCVSTIHNINSSSGCRVLCLTRFAAFLPSSDPCPTVMCRKRKDKD